MFRFDKDVYLGDSRNYQSFIIILAIPRKLFYNYKLIDYVNLKENEVCMH